MIRRLFVEKRPGFNVEAGNLLADLNETFGLTLEGVRVLNRYDIENIEDSHYEQAKTAIFSEPMADVLYEETFPFDPETEHVFAVSYLPGQYNQRGDSAEECIRILAQDSQATVGTAHVYCLKGQVSQETLEKIKAYLINPVDSREAEAHKPETLVETPPVPGNIEAVEGFTTMDEQSLAAYHAQAGLAMSLADLKLVQQHFVGYRRNPTATEIKVLDTYWSDHCRHTTFLTEITDISFEEGPLCAPVKAAFDLYKQTRQDMYGDRDKDVCLMDMATLAMKALKKEGKLQDLDESEEINACSIRVDVDHDGKTEPWLVMFKNETHNHPTEIEPFGGAATCLGGAIRDPLSGRSYVYQAVRVTGSGDPRTPIADTVPGKLPQKKISQDAAKGFSAYGNQIGLTTGHVAEIYHPGFVAKRMEVGAVVGAAPAHHVVREEPAPGDLVVLVGGRTGRDGCGGATGSSKVHTEQSLMECGAEVQKGNPVVERKIQRLFRREEAATLIKRCNDFGAGGVAVAVGELSPGLHINLDAVPKKYEGLNGTELAISESQERMAAVIAQENLKAFMDLCREENLEATVIATVTDDETLTMMWRGEAIVSLPRALMDTNGAKQQASASVNAPMKPVEAITCESSHMKEKWLETLSQLNVCSQKGLVERFDSSIGASTVLAPFGGKTGKTPAESAVSKIPVMTGETNTATIMAHGYDPIISEKSPFHGAVYAVVEALAKITACGGDYTRTRLSFQEYFERLGQDPQKWGQPVSGLLGAFYAQMLTKNAAIGGKDSMSGTFKDMHVPPVVAAFGLCPADARHIVSPELKKAGSQLVYVPMPVDPQTYLPDFDALHTIYPIVHGLMQNGKVLAAHTVKGHGLCEALSKMCFGNQLGVKVTQMPAETAWFSAGYGSLVLEIPQEESPEMLLAGVGHTVLGHVQEEPVIDVMGTTIGLQEALEAWEAPLDHIFPAKAAAPADKAYAATGTLTDMPPVVYGGAKFAKPRVFIPAFPGTNSEEDTRRAFEKAGASVDLFVFKNLTAGDVAKSLEAFVKHINNSQILALPGGFSAGDEPDGSAKFITVLFRNPAVMEATEALLKREGLVLGICNGFQALLKLGLLTKGAIAQVTPADPTLATNHIGRHIAHVTTTRVVDNRSPWLAGVEVGDEHAIAISHGEGRFVASYAVLETLAKNRQIATVYAQENPNGSRWAIEGITSPCGRIFGKMGHSERFSDYTYKNVPGQLDQKLFASGVKYFK